MCNERGIEAGLSGDLQRLGMAVVNGVRRHVANARVTVHPVVPGEEGLAVRARILDAAETLREVRPIFHRLELRLRVRVVVRDVWAAARRRPAATATARERGRIGRPGRRAWNRACGIGPATRPE